MRSNQLNVFMLLGTVFLFQSASHAAPLDNTKVEGYKGIWFSLGQHSEYGDKYSGGLGTYTAKHVPIACYSEEAQKTFFVYGGARDALDTHLLIMASYYDHKKGTVPKPTVVCDKEVVSDPHDNGSILLDGSGHLWVFVSGRGRNRPGYTYRSLSPFSIDRFERIREKELTYPQPWYIPDKGFFHCFTKYTKGRELYWETSADGYEWTEDKKLAGFGGHYQISCLHEERLATAFNYHPHASVDKRTNLYYVESTDFGMSWHNISGQSLEAPLDDKHNAALIHDFESEGRLVYLKDMAFDSQGYPVILVVTSADYQPGPSGDPRLWTLIRWNGTKWQLTEVTVSDHNYDMGSLYISSGKEWRIIAPTAPGPQPWGTGGEMVLWKSEDNGNSWNKVSDITRNSVRNHAYARRPVNAHPDFFAFWADGNPEAPSESHLYFTDSKGSQVWELPYTMDKDFATPKTLYSEK